MYADWFSQAYAGLAKYIQKRISTDLGRPVYLNIYKKVLPQT